MSEATIRAAIKTKVEAISNIGMVYDYERWATDWSAYLDLFKTTIGGSNVIRGWTITCQSFPQKQITFGRNVERTYTYKLRGYFGLDDSAASEKTAMVVVEDVAEAFNDTRFDASNDQVWNDPANLEIFEPRLLGDVLCHYAEITLEVTEIY